MEKIIPKIKQENMGIIYSPNPPFEIDDLSSLSLFKTGLKVQTGVGNVNTSYGLIVVFPSKFIC